MNTTNLWILSEERPKKEVIKQIIEKIAKDKKLKVEFNNLKIIPIIKEKRFSFLYKVIGVEIQSIENIFIKIVSGKSSFVDFLVFMQDNEPDPESSKPLYVIEETKTADAESRNTGIFQRCSKFVFVDFYYPNCKKIMLYNIRVKENRKPTETNIFGTRMLLTLGVEILGKKLNENIFKKFNSIDELIEFKNKMRAPPRCNTPILLQKYEDRITISGRLYKSGGLNHDPNIGALTIISKTLRALGWKKDIIIVNHGLKQKHVGRNNKFIKIANQLNIKLEGLTIPSVSLPKIYWYYEKVSEKLATIFLHLILENIKGVEIIYENHAGCERGYFKIPSGELIPVHKYIENDKSKGVINLPDLIICDHNRKEIICIEGKMYNKLKEGIKELKKFDAIEKEYILKYYPEYKVKRFVVLFGGNEKKITNQKVAFLLNSSGEIIIADHTPQSIKDAVNSVLNTRH